MPHFIRHVPCKYCGSSDAGSLYSDGGYHCFVCKAHEGPAFSPYLQEPEEHKEVLLPEDSSTEIAEVALNWLKKYELTAIDAIKHELLWSNYRQQLIYPFYEQTSIFRREVTAYQARNFSSTAKTKYTTKGNISNLFPIYHTDSLDFDMYNPCSTLVVVEDCASAIKLSRYYDAMPALGSDLSLFKITHLARRYEKVLVWLDGDMYPKAQKMARLFENLGVNSHAIYTTDDPKEIPYREMEVILNEF